MKPINTIRNLMHIVAAAVIAAALHSTPATGQEMVELVRLPPLPSNIQVPAGNTAFLKANAVGTQNYICLPSGWIFLGPQATLFVTYKWFNVEVQQQVATHFLSSNPIEGGMPRPTWQSSLDTSAVWAKAVASSNDPAFVAAGAIPWLLLQAAGTQRGPAGGSMLSQTTFIQRINTSGGTMPAGACTVGNTAMVPYGADYVFYKSAK